MTDTLHRQLIQIVVSNDMKTDGNDNLLQLICKGDNDNPDLVKELVRLGYPIHERFHFRLKHPIVYAVENGHTEITRYLLKYDVDILSLDHCLNTSIVRGFFSIFELLYPKCFNMYNCLKLACKHGRLEFVEKLMKDPHISINVQDSDCISPLMYACQSGNIDIIKLFFDKKEHQPNLKDKRGQTAFIHAITSNHYDIVEYLLKTNSKYGDMTDFYGRNAVDHAAINERTEIFKLLIANDLTPNIENYKAEKILIEHMKHTYNLQLWICQAAEHSKK
ncbi:ankyrin repeat-containing protein [Tetraselmis virus 1]|uniref:Ankyrin repeat-containing protein n=1 Tax=Tetraselmis virus 1 TaxID=2060617 RepID=A0A2P0VP31_9VIRU|nr:ankyrin repeat-containing protein [Tetraselmis virus 1]AUF82529.1 ankyrin repeat-containing protein [Tetraselmis virus 1]